MIDILSDFKAENIQTVPLENHVADSFVIATATGVRHLHSLAENLLEKMQLQGVRAHHVEGYGASPSARWVLVDYMDVVVHLFTEEGRRFYNLDRLMEERRPAA
ncbi:MAG: ribosome silencing factor [Candidatus Lindowbacteria bacterium RIFCSPLOWO2_12_FULL_62_27]|nr:MAG: ribosome silencing factor [Candidatus Lindowbacteria bacterium RIFCSPLOWO2_12_FULL_62_27]OGH63364.1 MAG: ribosome silencing factor [Candidatus Lindowbacteria bacterium RIFCSPLOWO2_02_FULL_62_12]